MEIFNVFSWFTTLQEKILALITLFVAGAILGWHLHTVFDKAATNTQLASAPAKMMDKQQALRKTNVDKEPCASVSIPVDTLKLLK